MHVAVVNLTRGKFSGGYKKYLRAILPLLRSDPRVSRLDVFNPPPIALESKGFEDPGHSWPESDTHRGFPVLKSHLRFLSPDVVFIPTARWMESGIPTAVMVRNMEPLIVPFEGNTISEGFRNAARRFVARRSCQHAQRVLAVSDHVRDYILSRWSIDPVRVGTVHHGIDLPLNSREAVAPTQLAGCARPIIFTAGSIRPARGLEDLIRALATLHGAGLHPLLVIAGDTNPGSESYQREMQTLTRRLGVENQVIWAGQLDAGEMAWCFQHCSVFVMTSRAEACPNTALEAMSYGCLSVSTDIAPMPEVFGGAALFYSGRDSMCLGERLKQALSDPESPRHIALREAGRRRALHFTWTEAASKTINELMICAAMKAR